MLQKFLTFDFTILQQKFLIQKFLKHNTHFIENASETTLCTNVLKKALRNSRVPQKRNPNLHPYGAKRGEKKLLIRTKRAEMFFEPNYFSSFHDLSLKYSYHPLLNTFCAKRENTKKSNIKNYIIS